MTRSRRAAVTLAAVAVLSTLAPAARAYDCMSAHGPLDPLANAFAERYPAAAARKLERQLADPASLSGPNARARTYALLANAYTLLDKVASARQAAASGLAAIDDRRDRALIDTLALNEAWLWDDLGDTHRALERYEAAARAVPESAPYLVCMLNERGYLRYRNDRVEAAIIDLKRAYSLAASQGFEADRADAANELAGIFRRLDFVDEAVPLADEAVDYYRRVGDDRELSDALRRRASTDAARHDFAAAEADLQQSLALARRSRDRFREVFAAIVQCEVEREAGHLPAAGPVCRDAEQLARTIEDPEALQLARVAGGEYELAAGRPRQALQQLDAAVGVAPFAVQREVWARIHVARSRARYEVGDFRGAYDEAQNYIEQVRNDARLQSAARIAVLRVQFETERTARELQLATTEKRLLGAKAAADRATRNATLVGALLGLVAMGLWLYGLQRRQRADRARRDVEQRLDAVGRLTGGVAHDFNNLMTVIQQVVGLLAAHPSLRGDTDAQGLLAEARHSAATGGAITRQLLAFSRQLDLRPENVDLDRYLADVRPILERAAGERAVLDLASGAGLPPVRVDRAQLTTALLNLVVNARDAMDADGTIAIRARRGAPEAQSGEFVRIDVADTGRGMPAEVLQRAIEPFFSTKGPGHGSGLGLSVVDGFVRQSGGQLLIHSAPGRGTTVTLWLPAARGGE